MRENFCNVPCDSPGCSNYCDRKPGHRDKHSHRFIDEHGRYITAYVWTNEVAEAVKEIGRLGAERMKKEGLRKL